MKFSGIGCTVCLVLSIILSQFIISRIHRPGHIINVIITVLLYAFFLLFYFILTKITQKK